MLNQFILVSGYAFWLILGCVILLDIGLLSSDDDDLRGWAIFSAMAALVGAVLFTDAFVGAKMSAIILGLCAYLALGVIWAFKKWYEYLITKRDEIRKQFEQVYAVSKDETWEAYGTRRRPTAANNKQRITTWMALWPFSVSYWALTWPRRAFVWLYERLSTIFDRLAARVFA